MKKVLILTIIFAVAGPTMASSEDDVTSLSYISYLERYATVRAANAEEALEAVVNMPLVGGDRIDTAREARMEVVLADGNAMWLDEYTSVSLDTVAFSRDSEAERTVLYLIEGSIIVEVSEFELSQQAVRVDSRGATVYLDEPGEYRLQALPSGGLRVEVASGLAEAATSAGGVLIRAQTSAEIAGGEMVRSEAVLTENDDFAAWVGSRRLTVAAESGKHVELRYSRQAAQLDSYGTWVYVDTINSWAWQPTVENAWQPYRAGRWYWTASGWSWISYEPWGWLPYHYGSWHFSGGYGWVWSWGGYWGPSWVSWVRWPGYIGWCPWGYYNSWYWGHYGGHHGGYYPSNPNHRPPYPGGGGGHAQTDRRNVVPPRTAGGRLATPAPQRQGATEQALDISGQVRMADIDRRGWTAVPESDFASPSLTRVARSGERIMPTGDQTGVVMSGALTTRSPTAANTSTEIERVFSGVASRSRTDVTPLLARDSTMSPEVARSIAKPTTLSALSRGESQNPLNNRGSALAPRAGASNNQRSSMPSLSAGSTSPFSASGTSRLSRPNSYRPTMYNNPRGVGGATGQTPATSSGNSVAPRSGASRVTGTRPLVVPPTGGSTLRRSSPGTSSTAPTVRLPTTGSAGSLRSPSTRSRSISGRSPTSSSSVGSRSRSSSPSAGSRSRPSSGGARPSGGASKPSAGSSRSSSAGSSRSSSAGSSKGSGGAARKR